MVWKKLNKWLIDEWVDIKKNYWTYLFIIIWVSMTAFVSYSKGHQNGGLQQCLDLDKIKYQDARDGLWHCVNEEDLPTTEQKKVYSDPNLMDLFNKNKERKNDSI